MSTQGGGDVGGARNTQSRDNVLYLYLRFLSDIAQVCHFLTGREIIHESVFAYCMFRNDYVKMLNHNDGRFSSINFV